jgi:murein DD-endopeptidase MepM/ murein hydrolase activator NlpD
MSNGIGGKPQAMTRGGAMMKTGPMRIVLMGASLMTLAACAGSPLRELDWDLRGGGTQSLDTSGAARQATANRPEADARGVISYPGYQVAVAQNGDTVASVAARVGLSPDELAKYNALTPTDAVRSGEVLALPGRVATAAPTGSGPRVIGATGAAPAVDVTAIATTALDRVQPTKATPIAAAPTGPEPTRHKVARGETAFSIARTYNVSAKALAEWNGLGADLAVREGQFLLIPTVVAGATPPPAPVETAPGVGSPTPTPPSAQEPLPNENPTRASAPVPNVPASPDLGADRTAASSTKMALPADGAIIRGYAKGKNEGIDIGAAAGGQVRAAADGTVAAITKDTEQVPIIVIRHADGLLTVYAGVDGITVAKGDKVKRGQAIAKVRSANPAFLHFEVRRWVESTDPTAFLQ